MKRQLVIPVEINEAHSFKGFFSGNNQDLISQLKQVAEETYSQKALYLWGESGSGKSHLLQACCHHAMQKGVATQYTTGQNLVLNNEVLSAQARLILIDDIESIEGHPDVEHDIFVLLERFIQTRGCLVISASKSLKELNLQLKDVQSRISAGAMYKIAPLSDEQKKQAIKQSAQLRGFELTDQVLNFMFGHYQRDSRFLFTLLDRLDSESLSQQRKITIPFIRELMN